jgi:hypothetical protein
MSIGSSVVDSVPTVGSTVHTLAKLQDGLYAVDLETGDVDTPLRLELRPSGLGGIGRKVVATWKFNPAMTDVVGSLTKGRVSCTFSCDASLGSEVTRANLLNHMRWFMGALLKATLLEALVDGSLE